MFDSTGLETAVEAVPNSFPTSSANGWVANSISQAGLNSNGWLGNQQDGNSAVGSDLNASRAMASVNRHLQLQALDSEFSNPWLEQSFFSDGYLSSQPVTTSQDSVTGLTAAASSSSGASTSSSDLTGIDDLGLILGSRDYQDFVGGGDQYDRYEFTVDSTSNLEIKLDGASAHTGLFLVQDFGSSSDYQLLDFSCGFDAMSAEINQHNLASGDYELFVHSLTGDYTDYNLNINVDPIGGIDHQVGSLEADQFDFHPDDLYTIYSGKGNVEFGQGEFDLIDLSHLSVDDVVKFNLANTNGTGGLLYDPGNGLCLFDAMQLNDGSRILFEGIDRIQFADQIIDFSVVPNDPLFEDQWNLHITGVHNAWKFTTGSSDVLIGIQDDGLELGRVETENRFLLFQQDIHPDLDNSRLEERGQKQIPTFSTSHGTGVNGIIAAASNNNDGISGINWVSNIWHSDVNTLQSGWQNGAFDIGWQPDSEKVREATQTMIDQAADTGRTVVINMSFGIGVSPELETLIAENQDSALFVIASGNDDADSLSYPAKLAQDYDNVIAVGASWGPQDYFGDEVEPGTRISYPDVWGSNYGEGLSLMAPSEVITTEYMFTLFPESNFGYSEKFDGTSAAAPHVTGIASLVWSVNPDLTASEVHDVLTDTAYDLSHLGDEFEYGSGLVDADAAVRRALALANPVSDWSQSSTLWEYLTATDGMQTPGISGEIFEPDASEQEVAAGDNTPEIGVNSMIDSLPKFDLGSLPTYEFAPTFDFDFASVQPNIQVSEAIADEVAIATYRLTHQLPTTAQNDVDWTPSHELDLPLQMPALV